MANKSMLMLICFLMQNIGEMNAYEPISNYFCNLSPRHTLCVNAGLGNKCGSDVTYAGVSNEDKELIVRLHNELRCQVAKGLELRGAPGPQPGATNMREMVRLINTITY